MTLAAPGQQETFQVGWMPAEVAETSGLIYYNGRLLTHNDSGNDPLIYELDTTSLEVVRRVRVRNAVNTDWEDLAQDDRYIYIGDIGNNAGNRLELGIYRIAKADYDRADEVDAELIAFTYEDQPAVLPGANSDWDAEALLAVGDQLLIFTKQWQSNGTKAYAIPNTPATHRAQLVGSYDAKGLITAAVYNHNSEIVYLLGYNQILRPFLLRLSSFRAGDPFSGEVSRLILDNGLAQAEGITAVGPNRYFFSSERFVNQNPPITLEAALYAFQTEDPAVEVPPDGGDPPGGEPPTGGEGPPAEGGPQPDLLIFSPSQSRVLEYELNREEPVYGRAIYDVQGRTVMYTKAADFEGTRIDLSGLQSAVYYLTFYLQGKTVSKPFFHR